MSIGVFLKVHTLHDISDWTTVLANRQNDVKKEMKQTLPGNTLFRNSWIRTTLLSSLLLCMTDCRYG